jgi:PD-(D/E)XK nuclease superfamily
MSEPTIVSNSEVSTFLSCERKHYYAHGMGIAPLSYGTSLSRGIIGHEALAAFFQAIKDGRSFEEATKEAYTVVDTYAAYGGDLDMLGGLRRLLAAYFEVKVKEQLSRWKIVAVEKFYEMEINDRLSYGMRLDLMVQYIAGPFMGEYAIVDHKFVYNFYSADSLTMDAQLPKYLGTAWKNGINANHAVLNQLRWRETKDNKIDMSLRFKEDVVSPSAKRVQNIMRDQIIASERILERRELPVEAYGRIALRTMGKMTCDHCSFVPLCSAELDGEENIALLVMTEYKPNTYGYTPEDREDG